MMEEGIPFIGPIADDLLLFESPDIAQVHPHEHWDRLCMVSHVISRGNEDAFGIVDSLNRFGFQVIDKKTGREVRLDAKH